MRCFIEPQRRLVQTTPRAQPQAQNESFCLLSGSVLPPCCWRCRQQLNPLVFAPLDACRPGRATHDPHRDDPHPNRQVQALHSHPEEQHNIDAELKRQLSGGCSEASCITQIGGALGARYMITGKFSRFGRRYVLFLKLIDIELGKAINTASIQANALEMILDDLERDLPALIGERRSDEPSARLTPLGPQVQGSAIRKAMGWVNIMAKRNTELFILGKAQAAVTIKAFDRSSNSYHR